MSEDCTLAVVNGLNALSLWLYTKNAPSCAAQGNIYQHQESKWAM